MNSKSSNLDLQEQAQEAVGKYLEYARSLNEIPAYQPNLNGIWMAFFDFSLRDNLFEYQDACGHVLAALTKQEVNNALFKEIGVHYLETLATILRRIIYSCSEFQTSEASMAELDYEMLDIADVGEFGAKLMLTDYTAKLEALKKRVAERPRD